MLQAAERKKKTLAESHEFMKNTVETLIVDKDAERWRREKIERETRRLEDVVKDYTHNVNSCSQKVSQNCRKK